MKTYRSEEEVSDEEIIAYLTEICQGVDTRFAGFVWEQTANDLEVSEERVLEAVEEWLAWEGARNNLSYIGQTFAIREGEEPPAPGEGYVYVFKNGRLFKIGSSINPDQRLKAINRNLPPDHERVTSWLEFRVPGFRDAESDLHDLLADKRVWSDTGGQEWFDLTLADLEMISALMDTWDPYEGFSLDPGLN